MRALWQNSFSTNKGYTINSVIIIIIFNICQFWSFIFTTFLTNFTVITWLWNNCSRVTTKQGKVYLYNQALRLARKTKFIRYVKHINILAVSPASHYTMRVLREEADNYCHFWWRNIFKLRLGSPICFCYFVTVNLYCTMIFRNIPQISRGAKPPKFWRGSPFLQ